MDKDSNVVLLALSVMRHLITSGAGVLATRGILSGDQQETFISAVMFLIGIAWSWYQKQGQKQIKQELDIARVKLAMRAADAPKPQL